MYIRGIMAFTITEVLRRQITEPICARRWYRLKKYFYVLRPLLSVRWLKRYQTTAPIGFQKPLHLPDDAPELLTAIDALLIKKRGAPEMGLAPQAPILNRSIEAGLRRLESAHIEHIVRPNVIDRLNALLHETVHRR